jgi:hypothetical protein
MNHGIAIAKENIGDFILKGEEGLITSYSPKDNIFSIYYGDIRQHIFKESETEFLKKFTIKNH